MASEKVERTKALYEEAKDLVRKEGLSGRAACKKLGLGQSAYYYHRNLEQDGSGKKVKNKPSYPRHEVIPIFPTAHTTPQSGVLVIDGTPEAVARFLRQWKSEGGFLG